MTDKETRVADTQYDRPLATASTNELVPLREQLAALAHEQWSGWMRYLFSRCSTAHETGGPGFSISGVGYHIPSEWAARWKRQIDTPYADLSDAEKDSDRKEADRVLAITESRLTALTAAHARELDEAVNEVWEDVVRAAQQVSRVIDERDELRAALAVALGFVTHKADCNLSQSALAYHQSHTCTCGAAAVLSQKGPIT